MLTLFIPILFMLFLGYYFAEAFKLFCPSVEGFELSIASAWCAWYLFIYFFVSTKTANWSLLIVFGLAVFLRLLDAWRERYYALTIGNDDDDDYDDDYDDYDDYDEDDDEDDD